MKPPRAGQPCSSPVWHRKFTRKIHFLRGKKYLSRNVALPAFDKNGKAAGIWLSPLTDRDGRLEAIGGEGRIMGNEDARFVALQNSRNGESLLAGNMGEGVRMARDNPDTGVVVRLAGDDRP